MVVVPSLVLPPELPPHAVARTASAPAAAVKPTALLCLLPMVMCSFLGWADWLSVGAGRPRGSGGLAPGVEVPLDALEKGVERHTGQREDEQAREDDRGLE